MAVSGHKLPHFLSFVSEGSMDYSDYNCDPCLSDGQHEVANGYCVDCKEYLCKNCFKFHQRTQALQHHELLDKDKIKTRENETSTTSKACSDKCISHNNEEFTFYCQEHKTLGCNDCFTKDHTTCKIDYISDKCADIGGSMEYKGTMWLLNQKLKEIDNVIKKATARDKEIDICCDSLIQEIVKVRQEINHFLDQLQKELETEADRKKSNDKQVVQEVLETCTNVSADINKLQSRISIYKNSKQNEQLYINIRQAQSKLKSNDVKQAEDALEKTNMQYIFERNNNLEKMLSEKDIFGKLNLSNPLVVPRKNPFNKLTHTGDIEVRTDSDAYLCGITGCAVLSSDKIVLTEYRNRIVKVVDIQSKAVTEKKTLESEPGDIAVLPPDKIAVTLPKQKKVVIMKADRNLTTLRNIRVKSQYWGITYHQDHLYAVGKNCHSVLVLDTKGNVKNKIPLNADVVDMSPKYVEVSEDSRLIYISGRKGVISITLQGEVSAVYKDLMPAGMAILDDGSLLVVDIFICFSSIQHLSADLKHGQTITATNHLLQPKCICYSRHHDEVYIGCAVRQLTRLSLK